MSAIYGREALRRAREPQKNHAVLPKQASAPLDAEYDQPDAILHVWNGEKWVPWKTWLATAPLSRDERPAVGETDLPASDCIAGDCAGSGVWLVKDRERWLMFVGSHRPADRRLDFASPFLEHAMRTAVHWFGVPRGGWCAESKQDG